MIYVSEELKQAFLSAEQKNLLLTFDDGTVIDNDDIALESMGLEQTLSDSDELRFGKISSACFKTKIKASTKRYKNLWFNASIGAGEYTIPLGRFRVYTDNMTSDRLYRDIVAYDTLFWAINTDVTEWYNGLTFPITQKAFRDSLFEYLGIEQEVVELPNDSITFNRTVNAENLTGLTVLQKLCEINATWGTINNVGKFKYVRVRTHEHDALYPSDNLFPSDDLFPDDIYDDRLPKASYYQGTLKYEEYDTQPITKVTIREDADDLGYSYGEDGNTYVIEDNFLLYGASDSTLQTVAKNFFDYAQYIAYTPSQLKCKGAPWREVGDLLLVVADKRTLTIPILNRQLSGITALKDTYIAKGNETYGEVKNSPTEQLKQLQSRTNKLTRTLDETKSEISKVETSIKTDGRNYLLGSKEETTGVISVMYNLSESKNQMNKQKLVLSFEAKARKSPSIIQISFAGAYETIINEPNVESDYKRYVVEIPIVDDFSELKVLQIKGGYFPTTGFYTRNAKLEIGENATEWTYAPEDLPDKFNEYSTTTEMRSEIKQSADEINLSVSETLKNYSTTNEMNSAISQTAESITSTVARNESKWIIDYETYTVDLFGYGTPANATAGDNVGKYYLDQETGILYTTIQNGEGRYVWNGIAQFESVQSDMYSKIDQNAYGITQRVVKGEVVSEINQSAEEVKIDSEKISLEGLVTANKNFIIDKNGSMEALDGKFSGQITGGSVRITGASTQQNPYLSIDVDQYKGLYVWSDGVRVIDYTSADAVIGTETADGFAELNGAFVNAFGFNNVSLESKKKNFEPLNNALDIVKSIDIHKYHYKNDADTQKKHIGLVIGENFNYSKEVTNQSNDSVDVYSLSGVCVKAINELIQIVDEQNNRIKALEERLGV